MNSLLRTPLAAAILATFTLQAQAASDELETIVVRASDNNALGTTDAASQGTITAKQIEMRPTLRPAEVLEFVPGMIVTQHSGDGKANQYFLRGFNLDHGTDFATVVDGMPVNMPTHAHGHGYSDLNWLIPELVSRIQYQKGPYYVDSGDFSSVGSAHLHFFDQLTANQGSITLGENGYRRGLVMQSVPMAEGHVLYALEAAHNDGPWDKPEAFHRASGVLRYSFGNAANRSTITAMAYSAGWNSTDQVPQRALNSGLIGRFGAIDNSDGGRTDRYSLSYNMQRTLDDGQFKLSAYAIQSSLDLFSSFTYFLNNPVDGDQFEQAERRQVYGAQASRQWDTSVGDKEVLNTLGLQVRHDRLNPVGLYNAVGGQRTSTIQESSVRETNYALFGDNTVQLTPWLRSNVGLRTDHFDFDVNSSIAANSGQRHANITTPKLSLVFGPWSNTEYFVNYGQGFHSNDARGTTATLSPKEGTPINPVKALVRTQGGEVGLRTEIVPHLQSSLTLWRLRLGSELVFSGDAGDTEPTRASLRQGLEWNNHYRARPWLLLDADLALSKARYTQFDPAGDHIPGAIETVASVSATVTEYGPWFGQFQLRYFGPRPLIEDNSQRSKGTTLASARIGYKLDKQTKLAVDVFNLFDTKASDIDYFYTSRLPGEAASGVSDLHSHPVEPRHVRVSLTVSF